MTNEFDIVTIADMCVDLAISGNDVKPRFGQAEKLVDDYFVEMGGSCNIFACQTAKLGLSTAVIGILGRDIFGELVLKRLNEAGVNTSHVFVDDVLKTSIGISLTTQNDRAILTYNSTCSGIEPALIPFDVVLNTRHLHIGSYFLMDKTRPALRDLIISAKKNGATISIDTNWDPAENWDSGIVDLLPLADVFLPNETELKLIMKENDLMRALKKASSIVPVVVAKLGKGGAVATDGKSNYSCGIVDVDVKDTIGAGDSFDGGFLYAYLSGMPLEDALRIGNMCGSYNTTSAGGIEGQITAAKLEKCLKAGQLQVTEEKMYENVI